MAIVGIQALRYGVEDLDLATKFFEDFGLNLARRDENESLFRLEEGSVVSLRRLGDPTLPDSPYVGPGVKEVVWGVDSQESLDDLVAGLSTDREVTRDADGTVRFRDDSGLPLGLRVYNRKKVANAPDPINAPGHIGRLSQPRKWKTRARPKTITHVVFAVNDPQQQMRFFRDRLKFRLSDDQIGIGMYMRADGANEHHNIFFLDAKFPALPGHPMFHHVNFGVEDIDELMVGSNYMQRKGWKLGPLGTGRHRIASALFCYIQCPAGGEAEYGADSDYIDDSWIPRQWNGTFGTYIWMTQIPPFFAGEQKWEYRLHPDYLPGAAQN